jgi:hypothetical protein
VDKRDYCLFLAAKDATEKVKSKEEVPKKASETGRETSGKEVEKTCPPFNFEHKMAKIKILSRSMSLLERVSIGNKSLKC